MVSNGTDMPVRFQPFFSIIWRVLRALQGRPALSFLDCCLSGEYYLAEATFSVPRRCRVSLVQPCTSKYDITVTSRVDVCCVSSYRRNLLTASFLSEVARGSPTRVSQAAFRVLESCSKPSIAQRLCKKWTGRDSLQDATLRCYIYAQALDILPMRLRTRWCRGKPDLR